MKSNLHSLALEAQLRASDARSSSTVVHVLSGNVSELMPERHCQEQMLLHLLTITHQLRACMHLPTGRAPPVGRPGPQSIHVRTCIGSELHARFRQLTCVRAWMYLLA